MILITGATGNVGKELLPLLIRAGEPVRIFVRNPQKAAAFEGQADIFTGDLNDRTDLETAMRSVDRVFLVTSSTQQDLNVIESARQARAGHIVKLSTIEAGHNPVLGHGKWHREREELIRASGLAWTFLRPTMFMSNTLDWAASIRQQETVFYPGGEGKVSPIDPADIAAVAAAALTSSEHENQAYTLTGPETLIICEIVEILGRVLGKSLRYENVPLSVAGEGMLNAGLPAYVVDGLIEAFKAIHEGRFAYLTDAVEQATGRKPRTYQAWCRDHLAAFQ
jgi:uncharacterized protein YbjT (DUF2867 family)